MSRGLRKPQISLVRNADRLEIGPNSGAGSAIEILHPVWEILMVPSPSTSQVKRWIGQLDSTLQSADLDAKKLSISGRDQCISAPGHFLLQRIESTPSLDALAYLTIIVKRAVAHGFEDVAERTSLSLCRVLWQLSFDFKRRGVIQEIFALFDETVMPLVQRGQCKLSLHSQEVVWLTDLLQSLIDTVERGRAEKRIAKRRPAMPATLEILRGRHGSQWRYLFDPAPIPLGALSNSSLAKMIDFNLVMRRRAIARARELLASR